MTRCFCSVSWCSRRAAAASDKLAFRATREARRHVAAGRAAESRTNFHPEVKLHDTQFNERPRGETELKIKQNIANQVACFIIIPHCLATLLILFIILTPGDEKRLFVSCLELINTASSSPPLVIPSVYYVRGVRWKAADGATKDFETPVTKTPDILLSFLLAVAALGQEKLERESGKLSKMTRAKKIQLHFSLNVTSCTAQQSQQF